MTTPPVVDRAAYADRVAAVEDDLAGCGGAGPEPGCAAVLDSAVALVDELFAAGLVEVGSELADRGRLQLSYLGMQSAARYFAESGCTEDPSPRNCERSVEDTRSAFDAITTAAGF